MHPTLHAVHHRATLLHHMMLLVGTSRIHLLMHTGVVRHLSCCISSRGNNRNAGKAGLP